MWVKPEHDHNDRNQDCVSFVRTMALPHHHCSLKIMRSQSSKYSVFVAVLAIGCAFSGLSPVRAESANSVPSTFTVSGSGYGHGIGLSQYGAYGMAIDYATNPSKLNPSCGLINNAEQQACIADVIVRNYYPTAQVSKYSDNDTPGLATGIKVGLKQDADVVYIRGEKINNAGGALDIIVDGNTDDIKRIPAGTIITFTHTASAAKMSWGNQRITGSRFAIKWNGTTTNGSNPGLLHLETSTLDSNGEVNTTATEAMADAWCYGDRDICHRYKYGSMDVLFGAFGNDANDNPDVIKDFNVVNTLRLSDEYLFGLGEMPSSWYHYKPTPTSVDLNTSAALQAQTIAARTYALQKVRATTASDPSAVRAACQCHLYATTSDQVFLGYRKEASTLGDKWVAAVRATMDASTASLPVKDRKWKVLTYLDTTVTPNVRKPINAFFSSSTGGYAQPVSEVWGSTQSKYPYLIKTDDHWALDPKTGNPYRQWSVQLTQNTLVSRLNTYLGTQGRLTDISSMAITGKTASGSVSELTVVDSVGTVFTINVRPKSRWVVGQLDITPDNIRSLIGSGKLIPTANSGFNGSTYLTAITNSSSTTPASPDTKVPKLTRVAGNKWPSTVLLGNSYTVTGSISPVQEGVRITLQRKLATGWTALDTTATDRTGKWSVTWNLPSAGSYNLRVEAANAANAVNTYTHLIKVASTLTLQGPGSAIHAKPMTVQGLLSPAFANAVVIIERKTKLGTWKKFATSKTDLNGKWISKPIAPKTLGTLTLRARIENKTLGIPVSPTIRIRIQ